MVCPNKVNFILEIPVQCQTEPEWTKVIQSVQPDDRRVTCEKKYTSPEVPELACPHKRREPLPWRKPKPSGEDREAPTKLETILNSPSYLPAIEDVDFLDGDDARGVRLELDYLKPERLLIEQGIEHTIVVFGSTRIVEPAAAEKKVQKIREALTAAAEDSAKTVGLNITLPHEQCPNPYITPELCFSFHYFALHKMHFMMRAKALVAFPGGFGTLDELFETLTLIQTRKINLLPVVLVGKKK